MDVVNKNQDGCHNNNNMMTSPDTSSSASPIDLVSQILNDDFDDFEPRGQRPSDEDDEVSRHHHLPLFKRGTSNDNYGSGSVGGSTPIFGGCSSSANISPHRDLLESPAPLFPESYRIQSGRESLRTSPMLMSTAMLVNNDVFSTPAPMSVFGGVSGDRFPNPTGEFHLHENPLGDLDILNQAVSLAVS